MSRQHRHNPLRLESLAAREVPATLSGTTLFVIGDGTDNVVSITTAGQDIVVRESNVMNNAPQNFPMNMVDSISVFSLGGDDRVSLLRLPAGTPTTVRLGDGTDAAVLGVGLLTVPPPTLIIAGDAGTDTVAAPTTNPNTWLLTGPGRGSVANAQFHTTERLAGGWMTDTFRFGPGADFAQVDGGLGVDRVDYTNYPAAVTVTLTTGTATGVAAGGLSDVENATGSAYADSLWGNADHNSLTGLAGNDTVGGLGGFDSLDGGAGNDRMEGGTGDDTMFGREGKDKMWGLAGADLMFGGADGDVMFGGDDRDILFGGAGSDALDGGAGDDILGSGATSFELNLQDLTPLIKIRAEWTSGRDYFDRVDNIRGDDNPTYTSRLNGGHFLETHGPTPTVTHPNGAEDSLIGGTGDDWFFGHAIEYDATGWGDRTAGERVNA
jgi:Ca2+-binding RTX toxin-like protein